MPLSTMPHPNDQDVVAVDVGADSFAAGLAAPLDAWKPIGSHRIPSDPTGSHRIPPDTGYHWIPPDTTVAQAEPYPSSGTAPLFMLQCCILGDLLAIGPQMCFNSMGCCDGHSSWYGSWWGGVR